MSNDLVSIIVPVYNAEKYLDACISSILKQTYSRFELLLIVDGATDRSAFICREYEKHDTRITVIEKENEGVSTTRNLGIQMATGEYICFIDADDSVDESYIDCLLNIVQKQDAEFAICKIALQRGGEHYLFPEMEFRSYCKNANSLYDLYVQGIFLESGSKYFMGSACRSIIKRDVLLRNHISFPDCKICEDQLFILSVLSVVNKVMVTNQALYFYNDNSDGSAIRTLYRNNLLDDQLTYWDELRKRIHLLPISMDEKRELWYFGTLVVRKRVLSNAAMQTDRGRRKVEIRQIYNSELYTERIPVKKYIKWLLSQPFKTIIAEGLLKFRMYSLLRRLRSR